MGAGQTGRTRQANGRPTHVQFCGARVASAAWGSQGDDGGHVLCAAARPGILYRMCARKATARKAPREQVGLGSTCALRLRGASRGHIAVHETRLQC